MLLKKIQYAIQVANILLLPILSFDKSKISKIIEILGKLIIYLGLDSHILYSKKVILKCNYMTIWNITQTMYYKQEKSSYVYRFSWIESVAKIFYL